MTKPLLFLDIDGVLCAYGHFDGAQELWLDGDLLWIHPDVQSWLRTLGQCYQLLWVSGREEYSNVIGGVLGLESLERMPLRIETKKGITGKLTSVAAYRKTISCPVAWVDDELYDDAEKWASECLFPTFLVRPNSDIGLTQEQVDDLVAFASMCQSSMW